MSSDDRITANTASMREWRGLTTQVNRRQWESQWMAQLGATSSVVEGGEWDAASSPGPTPAAGSSRDREQQSAPATASGAKAASAGDFNSYGTKAMAVSDLDAATETRSSPAGLAARGMDSEMRTGQPFDATAPARHLRDAFAELSMTREPLFASQAASDSQHFADETLALESVSLGATESVARSRLAADAVPNLTSAVPPPKPFALWRDENTVRFAMRTREPEKANEIISTLRGWLRSAGLSLRDVWINGRNHHGG